MFEDLKPVYRKEPYLDLRHGSFNHVELFKVLFCNSFGKELIKHCSY